MVQPVTKLPSNASNPQPRRMTLAAVKRGRLDVPMRVLAYGVEGVGKSTFAAGAPAPIFLGVENGTAQLDISRLPEPHTWDDALDGLLLLEKEKHDFETVVIDPVTWLEPLCSTKVTGGTVSIDKYDGGYGRGHAAALEHWRMLVAQLERLWTRGMHVVLLGHCRVKSFNDPQGPAYDRYELAMNANAAGLLRQWCDFVLFMRHEAFAKVEKGAQKAKGYSTGARVMHTQWSAAYDAKTRCKLPEELPISWSALTEAIHSAGAKVDDLKKEIAELVVAINDAEVTKKAATYVADAKDNADRLAEVANGLRLKKAEKETES